MTYHRKLETKEAPDGFAAIEAAIAQHAAATEATIAKQDTTIAKLTAELDGTKAVLLNLEQKAAGGYTNMPGGGVSLADELFKNPNIGAVASKSTRDTSAEVKASKLLGLETKNTVTNNDGDFHSVTGAGIFGGLERRRFIFDYLRRVPVTTGHVAVTKEVTFTNAAATQAAGSPLVFTEGAAKAESDITFSTEDRRLSTTAHFIKASNQALADVPQLASLLNGRLRHGLKVRVDAAIVTELTTSGNYTAFTPTSGDDGIASVNRAIAMLETNDAMATLILLNPATYRSLQRIRSEGGDGQHIVGQPQGVNAEVLWNVPVLPSNAVAAGKLIVIDTETMGEYYLREDARVDVGYVNDDFTKNLVTLRAEIRGDLQVVRAVSVVYGDLTL